MSVAVTDGPTTVAGATVVEARALHRLALGIVRDVAGVGAGDASVDRADSRGDLRVSVAVPSRSAPTPCATRSSAACASWRPAAWERWTCVSPESGVREKGG